MGDAVLQRAVEVLRGMAYEHRMHILMVLLDGEQTPGDLAGRVPAEATAISHHLRCLLDARLIRRRRHGRNVYYSLADDATRALVSGVIEYVDRPR